MVTPSAGGRQPPRANRERAADQNGCALPETDSFLAGHPPAAGEAKWSGVRAGSVGWAKRSLPIGLQCKDLTRVKPPYSGTRSERALREMLGNYYKTYGLLTMGRK